MNEYAQVMNSITELRRTLENRLQDCITADKAEKLAEAAVEKLHGRPAAKALLPQTKEDVLARAAAFRHSAKNIPETPWTSAYGAKFGGMRNFLAAAKSRHPLLEETKAMGEGTGAAGGYLVPQDFTAEVIRLANEASPILQHANIIPMSTMKRTIPRQIGNVAVGWASEGASRAVTAPTFGQIEQVAKVLGAVIKCSDELIRDSAINLTAFLSELVAEAMALETERVALCGDTASGDPFDGVLNASGITTVSMAGSAVCFDDVADLVFSLSDAYANEGTIVISRTGLKKLLKLKDTTGDYIWQPPSGDMPATLWNTPYLISSQLPANLGTGSDLTPALFGRFDKYLIVSPRQELEVKVSQDAADWQSGALESAFMADQTWMRFTQAMSVNVAYGGAFAKLLFK